ncbi:hypothetical protein SBA4_6750002 [Candidatus Sulfopaludibacter sp. SbA4]|nr:hypothetical protein SBA4_6750002 [Candidatus Sulfopaludibacter sp. SbA4]
MRQEVGASGGFGNARRGQQPIHEVAHVDGAEPPLAPGDLEHQAVGDGFQDLKNVGIARAIDYRRPHDDGAGHELADRALSLALGFSVVGQGARLGVFVDGGAIGTGADGGERTHMDQADGPPRKGASQILGGACIAGVVIVGAQGFGDAGEVNHGFDAGQGFLDPLAAGEVTEGFLDPFRKPPRDGPGTYEAPYGDGRLDEPFQQMAADEAGPAGDENHSSGMLRKATWPK